ncbi:hypothetical protein P9112_011929 [Eukaryota sp. TZLM1-RC]
MSQLGETIDDLGDLSIRHSTISSTFEPSTLAASLVSLSELSDEDNQLYKTDQSDLNHRKEKAKNTLSSELCRAQNVLKSRQKQLDDQQQRLSLTATKQRNMEEVAKVEQKKALKRLGDSRKKYANNCDINPSRTVCEVQKRKNLEYLDQKVEIIRAKDREDLQKSKDRLIEKGKLQSILIENARLSEGVNRHVLSRKMEFNRLNKKREELKKSKENSSKDNINQLVNSELNQLVIELKNEIIPGSGDSFNQHDLVLLENLANRDQAQIDSIDSSVSQSNDLLNQSSIKPSGSLIENVQSKSKVELSHSLTLGDFNSIMNRIGRYPNISRLSKLEQQNFGSQLANYRNSLTKTTNLNPSFSANPQNLKFLNIKKGEAFKCKVSLTNVHRQRASFSVVDTDLNPKISVCHNPPGKVSPGMTSSFEVIFEDIDADIDDLLWVKTQIPHLNTHSFLKIPIKLRLSKHSVSINPLNIDVGELNYGESISKMLKISNKSAYLISINVKAEANNLFSYYSGPFKSFESTLVNSNSVFYLPKDQILIDPFQSKAIKLLIAPHSSGEYEGTFFVNSTSNVGTGSQLITIKASQSEFPIKVINHNHHQNHVLCPVNNDQKLSFTLLNDSKSAKKVFIRHKTNPYTSLTFISSNEIYLQPNTPFVFEFIVNVSVIDQIDLEFILDLQDSSMNYSHLLSIVGTDCELILDNFHLQFPLLVVGQSIMVDLELKNQSDLDQLIKFDWKKSRKYNLQFICYDSIKSHSKIKIGLVLTPLASCSLSDVSFYIIGSYCKLSVNFSFTSIYSPLVFSSDVVSFGPITSNVVVQQSITIRNCESNSVKVIIPDLPMIKAVPNEFLIEKDQFQSIFLMFEPTNVEPGPFFATLPVIVDSMGLVFDHYLNVKANLEPKVVEVSPKNLEISSIKPYSELSVTNISSTVVSHISLSVPPLSCFELGMTKFLNMEPQETRAVKVFFYPQDGQKSSSAKVSVESNNGQLLERIALKGSVQEKVITFGNDSIDLGVRKVGCTEEVFISVLNSSDTKDLFVGFSSDCSSVSPLVLKRKLFANEKYDLGVCLSPQSVLIDQSVLITAFLGSLSLSSCHLSFSAIDSPIAIFCDGILSTVSQSLTEDVGVYFTLDCDDEQSLTKNFIIYNSESFDFSFAGTKSSLLNPIQPTTIPKNSKKVIDFTLNNSNDSKPSQFLEEDLEIKFSGGGNDYLVIVNIRVHCSK